MAKQSGLGRGLGSLIPSKVSKKILPPTSPVVENLEGILQIPTDKIEPNPHQPRKDFSHESLEDLINSIKEHGILQPLIVTKVDDGYQLIVGERRLRAAQILELETVPAIIRDIEEQQKLELSLIENIQRKDLNPIEQAVAYQRLIDEFNLTQEQMAKRLGKSRPVITNTLRLLTLPKEIQKAIIDEKINYSTARAIAGLPSKEQLKFFHKVLKQDIRVRRVEGEARKISVRSYKRRAKDPNIAEKEEILRQALGSKVTIKKSGDSGQIIIDFYSEEELADIIRKIIAD